MNLLALAFTAGMLAPVNPCGFALLPAWITGTIATGGTDAVLVRLARALRTGAVLTIGFTGTLTLAGIAISAGARTLVTAAPWLGITIGLTLAILGGFMLTGRTIGLRMPARTRHRPDSGVSTLRGHVAESCAARPRPDWLAVVSGQPEQVIRSRLCGLAGDPTALKQYLRRPLCQRCMARKGIHEPVYCYLPAHASVCHRHRRWIGSPTRVLDDQVDLRDRPTVLSAGRTHRRLARQYSEVDLHDALGDARHILVFWAHAERHVAAGILQNGLEAHVVAYPDVIAVAATLLTARPRVEQPRTPTEPAWPTLLLDRINERTGAHHADATPVEQWAQYRRLFATAVLTTRSDGAELACRA